MSKITHERLGRQAIVYIRQSTADHVANNLESQCRQHGLADRARQLGWSDVTVIDDDRGRSGGGVARPGFEKLLAAICEGRVGAVVSIEASRLARDGRDWHTLLEFCGLVGTLILDEDCIYDPRHPNDRQLLGMKGTMSEMELSVMRQRSLERPEAEGVPWRAPHDDFHRLRADWQQPHREGSGSAHCEGNCACLRQVRRDAVGASGAFLAQARAHPIARCQLRRRRSRDRMEIAGIQHDPAYADQSDQCWRLCLRTHRQPRQY